MSPREIRNMAASVQARLVTYARDAGRPHGEVLQLFAIERFLYRLAKSPHRDGFVLKGGLMLLAWRAPFSRPTRDIDLLGRVTRSVPELVEMIREVCTLPVEDDGVVFDPKSVVGEPIRTGMEGGGVRVRLAGKLGSSELSVHIDVGFGDVLVPAEQPIEYPTILEFPPPSLAGYSRESVVAEKLQAMVHLADINSRMGDFYDLWLLPRQYDFDGPVLSDAIRQVFSNRGTIAIAKPVALTPAFGSDGDKQKQWTSFVSRSRLEYAPARFAEVVATIADFAGPILSVLADGGEFEGVWVPPGLWTDDARP